MRDLEWTREDALRVLEGVQTAMNVEPEQIALLEFLGVDPHGGEAVEVRRQASKKINERWPDVAV